MFSLSRISRSMCLTTSMSVLIACAVMALPALALAGEDDSAGSGQPNTGFGAPPVAGQGGATPPPSRSGGTMQPGPTGPGPGARVVYGQPAQQPVLPFSPISLYSSIRLLLGIETFNDQTGFDAPTAFSQSVGFEFGITLNLSPTVSLTFVPLCLDIVNSRFEYTDPDTDEVGHTSILGSRVSFGVLADVGPISFGLRFGDRDYWSNYKVGSADYSVIDNDYNRDIVTVSAGWNMFGYGFIGCTVEIPVDCRSSQIAVFLDLAFRLYFP